VPAFRLKEANLIFTRYLDDFWFVESTPERLTAALDFAVNVFQKCGLAVNPKKREGPAQRLVFLGILFDSINQTLSCTPERLEELKSRLQTARIASTMRVREAQSLLGKLSFASQVLPGSRPFMRRLFDTITERSSIRKSSDWERTGRKIATFGSVTWNNGTELLDGDRELMTSSSSRPTRARENSVFTLRESQHNYFRRPIIGARPNKSVRDFAGEFHLSHPVRSRSIAVGARIAATSTRFDSGRRRPAYQRGLQASNHSLERPRSRTII
jgi:hypothetical protein